MEPKGYEQWYGNWTYMVVATLIFGVFTLALLRPRKKRDWRGAGVLQAFFISLFAEMFGFPLTILLIGTAFILIGWGWFKLYRGKGNLVTTGLYSIVRHPQYLGLILIIIGFNVQWPTFPTLIIRLGNCTTC